MASSAPITYWLLDVPTFMYELVAMYIAMVIVVGFIAIGLGVLFQWWSGR